MGLAVWTTVPVVVGEGSTLAVGVGAGSGTDLSSSDEVAKGVDLDSTWTVGTAVGVDLVSAVGEGEAAGDGPGTTASVGIAVGPGGLGVLATGKVAAGGCRLSAAGVSSDTVPEVNTPRATNPATPPTSSVTAAIDTAQVASLRCFNSDLPVLQAVQKSPSIDPVTNHIVLPRRFLKASGDSKTWRSLGRRPERNHLARFTWNVGIWGMFTLERATSRRVRFVQPT